MKLKFNSLSMESESENGIFLFILLPQWQLRVNVNFIPFRGRFDLLFANTIVLRQSGRIYLTSLKAGYFVISELYGSLL